jgi:hypothetical protein
MARLRSAATGYDVEILATTVTLREHKLSLSSPDEVVAESGVYDESRYDSGAVYADPSDVVFETAVAGEWRAGMAVAAGDDALSRFEAILAIISSGSFPKNREALTTGEEHQLRDAMILDAHTREGRDIFVSDDTKAFVGPDGSKRARLEALCGTKIMTVDEFCARVAGLATRHT